MRRLASGVPGLVIAIAGAAGFLLADPPEGPVGITSEAAGAVFRPNTYGTSDETILYVGAAAFTANRPNVAVNEDGSGSGVFVGAGGNSVAWAPVNLPQGSLITGLDFYFFDADAATDINAVLYEFPSTGGANGIAGLASSGSAGFGSSTMNLGPPWTVNNDLNAYSIFVYYNAVATSNLKWRGVKVRYKLQVSPAPATATFTDVPASHPFFKFVEALTAAGITGGYPDGRFGVNDPVTRGQMAVFLATALGLHWN